jgi:hypothetical protein
MGYVQGATDIEAKYEYWINFGVERERERILTAIKDASPSMDFFGPHIAKENLYKVIKGES